MHKKINALRSQFQELEAYYDGNKDDLNSQSNASKDLKFFWKKKIEQQK